MSSSLVISALQGALVRLSRADDSACPSPAVVFCLKHQRLNLLDWGIILKRTLSLLLTSQEGMKKMSNDNNRNNGGNLPLALAFINADEDVSRSLCSFP